MHKGNSMEKSFLYVSEKGLEFPNGAKIFGVHTDFMDSWNWHLDRGPMITPNERWWKTEDGMDALAFCERMAEDITENFEHIELDLHEDDEESPEEYTQEELEWLTEEWMNSGTDLDFDEWLNNRKHNER